MATSVALLRQICLSGMVATTGKVCPMAKLGLPLASLSFPPIGVYRQAGMRKRRAMALTVKATQNDGKQILPSNLSTSKESIYRENGVSTSTFEEVSHSSSPSPETQKSAKNINEIEVRIERTIFDFRFLTLFGVVGSLLGAVLCFLKGCLFVVHSYREYIKTVMSGGVHMQACFGGDGQKSRVILYLVEAVDVYLMGTVMLIFGMGLYELFVSSLEVPDGMGRPSLDGSRRSTVCGSNLFGLFRLRERPKWLEIRSLDELKTKLGHIICMILLVGMFEKSKKIVVHTSMDFLCFSASILLSSGALYVLSMLQNKERGPTKRLTRA